MRLSCEQEITEKVKGARTRLYGLAPNVVKLEPKAELTGLQHTIAGLRNQVREISETIAFLKRENAHLRFVLLISENYTPYPPIKGRKVALDFALRHGIAFDELCKQRRHKWLVRLRHAAMYEVHKRSGLSLPQIGHVFGGFDHTTVLHAIRKTAALIEAGEIHVDAAGYVTVPLMDRMAA